MNRVDQAAEIIHNEWWKHQLENGITLGPRGAKSMHPHMVAWESLSEESRGNPRFQAAVLIEQRLQTGKDLTPADLHEAWRRWMSVLGKSHHHAFPYSEAHGQVGPCEHKPQADKLNALFKDLGL